MIHCIGVGPGDYEYLTLKSKRIIDEADVVAGFDAVVDVVRPLLRGQRVVTMSYRDQVEKLAEVAAYHHAGERCVVVGMGDIHFSGFQLLERVETACGHPVPTLPGISSALLLAGKGRVCFDDTTFVTFHRRGDLTPYRRHLRDVLAAGRNAIVIPRPWDFMPADIAADLLSGGASPDHAAEVWENLSRAEAHWSGPLSELPEQTFSDMSILLIRALAPLPTGLEGEK